MIMIKSALLFKIFFNNIFVKFKISSIEYFINKFK